MIINEDNEYETGDDVNPNAPEDDDYDNDGEDAYPSDARTIVVSQRALNVLPSASTQRCNLFHTKALVDPDKACKVIIDGGSCRNLASKELCTKLKLKYLPHPHPYYIRWLSDNGEMKESHAGGLMGHFGREKTLLMLADHFYWPKMRWDVDKVLVRVLLMDAALVPRSLVLRQMGGGTGSWTVPVYLLRGFGAQAAAGFGTPVAIQVEDPIPPNGTDPHPFVAPNATPDQQGAVNLQQWWQNNEAAHDTEVQIPQPPPGSLVNLNSIPAAQGVNAEDGSVPANNVFDDLDSEGFDSDDTDVDHLDLEGAALPAADISDDEYVLVNVQHAINLSDALAAAIADVQINLAPAPTRNMMHPLWGPIQENSENQLAIVPFQPQGMPSAAQHAFQPPLAPSDPQLDVPETSAAAASRKRARPTPTSVALLRRNPRINKYQGFKQQLITDKQSRKSQVKPSTVINIEPLPPSDSNVLPVNTINSDAPRAEPEDQVPPPTPVQVLQQVVVNLCGVPEEEITQELLQAPPEDKKEDAQADEEEDAAT
ncbi:hypothetical protein QYE76_003256 [Lolium multiflorum]|uniref:Integrase zinc-binding domain-containing protein n=1 Tax=Lolium multiflorum TaxID=4521 RepID=A0AAD8RNC9_LOLMU|nr:hypothetical protein QYE76_003256 [Lolium multiflorum]